MLEIGIVGITGFTGLELIKGLIYHKEIKLAYIASRSEINRPISDIYPQFQGVFEKKIEKIDADRLSKLDLVFLALPHTISFKLAKELDKKTKIIDLSADFRLNSPEIYKKWYKVEHEAKELINEAAYGLPEINKNKIKKARIVANPGCYATSAILGIAPVAQYATEIIIDAKSGVSGAGRAVKEGLQFCEINENFKAYSIEGHRHIAEIEQELKKFNKDINVTFIPHLIPIQRGILSTIYISIDKHLDFKKIYKDFYKNSPFIRITKKPPSTNNVRGTNFCDLYVHFNEKAKKLIVISVIDNLIKGASGQAIQNMNIMFEFNEKEGLNYQPYYP